jgi:hypothetical protein
VKGGLIVRSAIAALLLPAASAAQAQNLVPSCYARYPVGLAPAPPVRSLFVLIDQTTRLDAALTQTLRANVARLVRPGTSFTIARFSAFQAGHYAEVVASGTVEPPVPAQRRNSLSVPKLRQLDRCLQGQTLIGVRIALAALATAQHVGAASFAQSELMASLKQLSSPIGGARAHDKIVIIASDMLEHSSATSFYARRGLRTLDPRAELRKAAALRLFGNFGGARAYVIGAGILPPESRDAGRTIPALNALEAFWSAWLRQSNARLGGFGKPNLLSPIP